ncbi:hypothetical protein F383_07292 [Gossypium arboreum]|uniref:Uncharacterized protein n=1 Tax=Gossypium arboreum TaxID=29729 RepID=A0A0B0PL37_GOSAR|nr:hypothetical protein F383_07292 [Gossypium arboreum]
MPCPLLNLVCFVPF